MRFPKITPGGYGWLGIVAYVTAADVLLIKNKKLTLSSTFRNTVKHPLKRWPVTLSWLLLTAHLFTSIEHDPINIVGRFLGERLR